MRGNKLAAPTAQVMEFAAETDWDYEGISWREQDTSRLGGWGTVLG